MKTKNQKLKRLTSIIGGATLILSFIMLIITVAQLSSGSALERNLTINFLWVAILGGIAIIGALVDPIKNLFISKKSLGSSLLIFAGIIVIVVVAVLLARTNADSISFTPKPANFASTVHLIEIGLILMYFTFSLTIIAFIFSEVRNNFIK